MLQRGLAMRALALDIGSKTIGLAMSDADGLIATALDVHPRQGHAADAAALIELVRARHVDTVVAGIPYELDGREGRRARAVRQFLRVLEPELAALGVGLQTWDERFSTAAAERTLLEADVSRRRRKQTVDAVAAQFILQGWLDRQASLAAEVDA